MSALSNLPLQEMINGVIRSATTKMAAHPDDWAAKLAMEEGKPCSECGTIMQGGEKCACMSKTAATIDPDYIEKLASACDFLSSNVDNIETPNRGALGNAIAKMAGEAAPPTNPNGALEASASMAGEQTYKKDKPKPGYDAAVSTAGTPEGTAGLPGGATQMQNDMESAPGQASGSVPTAKYPTAGPLHAGPTKTAGLEALLAGLQDDGTEKTAGKAQLLDALRAAGTKASAGVSAAKDSASAGASRYKQLMQGGRVTPGTGSILKRKGEATRFVEGTAKPGNSLSRILSKGTVGGQEARKSLGARAATAGAAGLAGVAVSGKEKSAGDLAREAILSKLAGEDVMKSNISSPKSGGPIVGDGELQVMDVIQHSPNPTDGSGYGNQQRGMIGSNQAAIDCTKGGAKKPRATELAEVLRNPAFSPKHDGKLQEQLQNTGKAGVKIAGAQMRGLLKQAAAKGLVTQEMVDNIKIASAGCSCGGQGTCRSCKLEALKDDAQKTSQVSPPPMGGAAGGPAGGMGGSL